MCKINYRAYIRAKKEEKVKNNIFIKEAIRVFEEDMPECDLECIYMVEREKNIIKYGEYKGVIYELARVRIEYKTENGEDCTDVVPVGVFYEE